MSNAPKDGNDVSALLGTSSVDGSAVPIWADPVTHRLLVNASGGGGGSGTVTNVTSVDGSITVTSSTTTPDLSVVSAPKLTTARTINGTSFDGSANITVTAAAGTLTGATLNATVLNSSLTSVGTIATGTWNGSVIIGTYGGTGVNNGTKTFTYLKNISFTAADDTGVYTLPTGTKTLIDTTVATLSSLASIGTIGTGTWQGSVINSTYGGTGINNGGRTLTLNTNSGTIAFSGASKTITFANTLTFTGTDSSSVAFGTGGTVAYTSNNLSVFASTTSAQLAGIISDETGSGSLVFATSPALITPTIDNATGISLKLSNNSALTLGTASSTTGAIVLNNASNNKTTTIQSATTSTTWTMTLPTSAGTNAQVLQTDGSGNTSWVAQTGGGGSLTVGTTTISNGSSGRILYDQAGVLGEAATTGTNLVVLSNSPTLVTPILGAATATTINSLTLTANTTGFAISGGTASKTLIVNNSLTLVGTDNTTMTFAALSSQIPTANQIQYDYVIYKSGSTTIAQKVSDGSTFSSNTTSSTVFQAVLTALTTGGNVLIKDATYTITAALTIRAANTRIFGMGNNTILQADGNLVSPLISNNSTSFNNCQIERMVINNTNASPLGTALKVNDSAFGVYRDLQFNNWLVGIQMTDSVNTTFYNSFYDLEIFSTTTCLDICTATGNPVNDNSFYRIRTSANANGYGVRIRGGTGSNGSNGNNFYSFDAEPASISGQKGVSIEGNSYANTFHGSYIEGNAFGVSIASGSQGNTFIGGNIEGNTTNQDIVDAGNNNNFYNISRSSDIYTIQGLPMTVEDDTANSSTFLIQNNTNFAHVSSSLIDVKLRNSSDTSNVVKLENAGTGPYVVADSAFALAKSGKASIYASVNTTGWGVPAIYGNGRFTAQTAAKASVATYTVGAADGSFMVSANVLVTTSTAHTFTVTCTYTDESNTSRTLTLTFSQISGTLLTAITNVTGAGAYEGIPLHIRAKAGTAITIASAAGGTYTTVVYNIEGTICQIS